MSRQDHADIVAVGASAGGVAAISALLKELPGDLPASVLVVLHRSVTRSTHLREILARHSRMPVVVPRNGDVLRQGVCYVGEPARHLTVGPGLRVAFIEDGFYRSHNVDALFSSLARNAGRRTIGVVLSGLLKDGTLGLSAIKEAGGIALVQTPEEAEAGDMPLSAIRYDGHIDLVAPVHLLAREICRRTGWLPTRATAWGPRK
jgi:two-component system chemotaxis response regulator CheB